MWDYTDENAILKSLQALTTGIDSKAKVLTYSRLVPPNSATVSVTYLIMCGANNADMVKGLLKAFLPEREKLVFSNSQLNLESGNLEIDYLYVKAEIKPNLK